MIDYSAFRGKWNGYARLDLDRTLHCLSAYAVPIVIGIFSILALFTWRHHYHDLSQGGQLIAFQVLQEADLKQPADALKRIERQPKIQKYDTQLDETPVWIYFKTQPQLDGMPVTVELPSRHAQDFTCWDPATLGELGKGNRGQVSGAISAVKTGFGLTFDYALEGKAILCRATFIGPARLTMAQWPADELLRSAHEFDRNSGLLDGGLIVLGMFVLITAMINRQSTYLLFAAWLLVNLRMAGQSSGWDTQWLGHTVPPDLLLQIRPITMAIYYLLTVTLFRNLFRDELVRVGHMRLLTIVQYTCLPVVALAIVLPYRIFLPILWLSTGFGSVVLVILMARILMLTRSQVAIWYSASIGVTLFSSLYEVISAAMGIKGFIGSVNFVTAALSSSLLAALAIAAQLRQKHEQWLEAQAELQHTYEAMPIGLFTLDTDGQFLSANPALSAMLGEEQDQVATGHDLWTRFFKKEDWERLHRMVHTQTEGELEIQCSDCSGGPKRFLVRATLARGKIEGSLQDITARAKATAELHFMANNDPLTKVLNRRGIESALQEALDKLDAGVQLSLAYLDLDRFKLINDLYGHPAGDEVLKQVCERINSMLSGEQRIGRVGGDEFVIILPDTPIALASWVCRGIVDSIGMSPYYIGDKAFQVRGSIGLIEVGAGTKIKDAVSTADRACRGAKAGSDGLVVYEKNAAAFRERESELQLIEQLSTGQAPAGLFLDMQPIMSLKNPHASLNFEVLLRMRDTDGTVIPAGRLIPAAESSGRIGVLDRWVLSTTLAWLNTNYAKLDHTQFVCMNLSGASLNDERFVQDAFEILEKNRHVASLLCLEITESVALHDLANTRRFIDQVRSYGVKTALDDFGAGYTSFTYLKDLPSDVLKIDGNFIVNMNAHPANVAIVEAMVSLAMNLGMKTIAEWAEDAATVQTLVEIGVDYVQGYAVARPQTPESILAADSSASFIKDRELESYVRGLTMVAEEPPAFMPGITLVSSGGLLVTK